MEEALKKITSICEGVSVCVLGKASQTNATQPLVVEFGTGYLSRLFPKAARGQKPLSLDNQPALQPTFKITHLSSVTSYAFLRTRLQEAIDLSLDSRVVLGMEVVTHGFLVW